MQLLMALGAHRAIAGGEADRRREAGDELVEAVVVVRIELSVHRMV